MGIEKRARVYLSPSDLRAGTSKTLVARRLGFKGHVIVPVFLQLDRQAGEAYAFGSQEFAPELEVAWDCPELEDYPKFFSTFAVGILDVAGPSSIVSNGLHFSAPTSAVLIAPVVVNRTGAPFAEGGSGGVVVNLCYRLVRVPAWR